MTATEQMHALIGRGRKASRQKRSVGVVLVQANGFLRRTLYSGKKLGVKIDHFDALLL